MYDKLALNQGWDTMIRPATAFRFKDRIFGSGESLDSLFAVLGKWKDGMSILITELHFIILVVRLICLIALSSCLYSTQTGAINKPWWDIHLQR